MAAFDSTALHSFERIPKELRLRVYKLASLEPRTLNICSRPHRSFIGISPTSLRLTAGEVPFNNIKYFVSSTPSPTTLQICHESRAEAQSVLTKAFCSNYDGQSRYIWTNFNLDTIRIGYNQFGAIEEKDKSRILRLDIEYHEQDESFFCNYHLYDFVTLKQLLELRIMTEHEVYRWEEIIEQLWEIMERAHGKDGNWVCPEFKVIEESTGIELNRRNWAQDNAPWRAQLEALRLARSMHQSKE